MRIRRWTQPVAFLCRVDFELSVYQVCCCCVIAACSDERERGLGIIPTSLKDIDARVRLVLSEVGKEPLERMAASYKLSIPTWNAVQKAVLRLFEEQ